MPVNQITIPQSGKANNAPAADGTPGPFQPGSTPVPSASKADGRTGTGSNSVFVRSSTPIPNPAQADGQDGSWSRTPFSGTVPSKATLIPHPGGADDQ